MASNYFNNSRLALIVLFLAAMAGNLSFAQTILPGKSVKIDTQKLAQCKKTVNQIKAMPLICDTILFKPLKEYDASEHCISIYFDKEARIRKSFFRHNIYDGAHELTTDTAYYSETGELIYFTSESSNHCSNLSEYYYVNDGRIVDFKCEYTCSCCDEDLTEKEIDDLSPVVGSRLTEKFMYGIPLVNFLHVDTLSKKLKNKLCWRENYTGTAHGVLFYGSAGDDKRITLDIQNTKANLNIRCNESTDLITFYDKDETVYDYTYTYTTRTTDRKAKITYFHRQDQSNSLHIEYQGETFSIGDISGYKFIDGLTFSHDWNEYQNRYQYPSVIHEHEEYRVVFTVKEIRLKSNSSDSFMILQADSAIIFVIKR